MRHRNDHGFAPIEGILAVLIVVLIGIAGYYAYQAHNKVVTINQTPVNPVAPKTPTDTAQYLSLAQMGIKLPLSGDIKDLIYRYVAAGSDASGFNHDVAYFTSSSVKGLGASCANDYSSLGSITKYGLTDQYTLNNGTQEPVSSVNGVVKVGSSYYLYETGQSACLSEGSPASASDVLNKQVAAIVLAVKGLRAN